MCLLKRCEILADGLVYIQEGPIFFGKFEVRRLIERIWCVPVSLVTCVMAALSLVLSVARRVARNVLFQYTIQLPCYSKRFARQYNPCHVSLQRYSPIAGDRLAQACQQPYIAHARGCTSVK